MFTVNKRPMPKHIRRDFEWEIKNGRQIKSACAVKAVANRAVMIAEQFHCEQGDIIDLTEQEFANHKQWFTVHPASAQ